jgi:hypothetical protein
MSGRSRRSRVLSAMRYLSRRQRLFSGRTTLVHSFRHTGSPLKGNGLPDEGDIAAPGSLGRPAEATELSRRVRVGQASARTTFG